MVRLFFILFLMFPAIASAAPAISSGSGTFEHGESYVITGTDFGEKSPAKPLMWDDCESGTVGAFPSGSANSASQGGYSEYYPTDIREGEDIPDACEMNYRSFPHTHVTTPVTAPHSHSTKFLGGAHYEDAPTVQDDPASGRDVDLTVATPAPHYPATHWYVNYYYRVNPEWPECGVLPNHKTSCLNADATSYFEDGFSYFNFNNSTPPCTGDANLRYRHHHDIGTCDDLNSSLGSAPTNFPNPLLGWVKVEEVAIDHATNGGRQAWGDRNLAWSCTSGGAWFTARSGGIGIVSYTIGGYYRVSCINNSAAYRGYQDSDAFRYFDDIYIDSTLSRVVLGDNATYLACTVLEPQPPTAWSPISVTVTVNAGQFDLEDTAYLFVVDSAGTVSSSYEVTIGGTDLTAPTCSSRTIPVTGSTISFGFNEIVTSGAGGTGGFTITPTGGAATLTYQSGIESQTLVYSISRVIESTETVTASYINPGNGIEDMVGNNLDNFTAQAVDNQSGVGGTPSGDSGVELGGNGSITFGGNSGITLE